MSPVEQEIRALVMEASQSVATSLNGELARDAGGAYRRIYSASIGYSAALLRGVIVVQAREPVLQLGAVLARDERLHQVVLGHRLAAHQVLHEPLLVEQLQDVLEGGLQALLVVGLEFHGRCRSMPVRVGEGEARCAPPKGGSAAQARRRAARREHAHAVPAWSPG